MFKNYLAIATIILSQTLSAQITLSRSANAPSVGDSFRYIIEANVLYHPGSAGANDLWDFSGIVGSPLDYTYHDVSNSSQAFYFPNANLLEDINGTENFLRVDSSGASIEGSYDSASYRSIYSDGEDFIRFPLSFGDRRRANGTYSHHALIANQYFNYSENIRIDADGYGDLILPFDTIHNVLRVRVINIVTENTTSPWTHDDYTDTICYWYNAFTRNFIAKSSLRYRRGSYWHDYIMYMDQSDLKTNWIGLEEKALVSKQLEFYPNPARDLLYVENPSRKKIALEIYSISGALLTIQDVEKGRNQIDLSHLKSGLYLLKYIQGKQAYSERLVIE